MTRPCNPRLRRESAQGAAGHQDVGAGRRGPRIIRQVKIPTPRILGENETHQKLDQWKSTFILYYSRDDAFATFLDPETTWRHELPNYGFRAEIDGLERSPAKMKTDLKAFFQLVNARYARVKRLVDPWENSFSLGTGHGDRLSHAHFPRLITMNVWPWMEANLFMLLLSCVPVRVITNWSRTCRSRW